MREIKLLQAVGDSSIPASQRFSVPNTGQERMVFHFKYITLVDRWMFDLTLDDEAVILGQKVVLNVNLFAPYGLGIGALFAYDVEEKNNRAGYNEIASGAVRLYHMTELEQYNARG